MKKLIALFFVLLLYANGTVQAQMNEPARETQQEGKVIIDAQTDLFKNTRSPEIMITNLQVKGYDNISILDKTGTVVFKKSVNAGFTSIDLSQLENGVYILRLWSSSCMIEKSIKVIVCV